MFNRVFTVETVPVAKGRPRFRKLGKFVSTYTPKKTKTYEDLIRDAAIESMDGHEPLDTPIRMMLMFYMPIPVSYPTQWKKDCLSGKHKHTKKPDTDNLAKSVIDAMNGVVYKDDGQIINLHAMKEYSSMPRIEVVVIEEVP